MVTEKNNTFGLVCIVIEYPFALLILSTARRPSTFRKPTTRFGLRFRCVCVRITPPIIFIFYLNLNDCILFMYKCTRCNNWDKNEASIGIRFKVCSFRPTVLDFFLAMLS